MQIVFGPIFHIEFDNNFTLKEEPSLNFLTDKSTFNKLIAQPSIISLLGGSNIDQVMRNNVHLMVNDIEQTDPIKIEGSPLWLISVQKLLTQTFLTSLWLVKDNAVNTGNIYFGGLSTGKVIIDVPAILFSDSVGEYVSTYYSNKEIEKAKDQQCNIIKYYMKDAESEDQNYSHVAKSERGINNFNKFIDPLLDNRITRALTLTTIARSQSFLPAKVASYISAIEALISSERDSLKMQVSERTAMIIGTNREDKLKVHDSLQDAYKARSSFVHGDKLSDSVHKKIETISKETDDVLRRLLLKVIHDYPEINEMNSKRLTTWFKDKFLFN